ncbi:KpsF/GutQ family sugar-phosphate isomerase [Hansschlegelia zhihuaiae]|uniref:KpsF/GutQ family sugar-phosphate isomerase n=1 Tax=Hansschlegelia zhihuaiae TaxID=405005 RepID=A0A4Q0M2P9_9HYPH|nr:KpsF/GutQ family sugar-phosphate isomerase [Hansschlegelia zhihuaiae]RXF66929.1 KpsF/GutQ family sugar-phosphate isomerase [Hansschlegelia zhihuaiae]
MSAGAEALAAVASAIRTIEIEQAGLASLGGALKGALGEAFAAAVAAIAASRGRVIVSGMGKSGHVGRKIAATLASTGTPAFFVHPAEASHGDLGMIASEDVILALSWSGETAELRDMLHYASRFRVPVVAVTSSAASALGRSADVVLTLPRVGEACPHGLAPTTSTTMQLALGDALSVALLESRKFTPGDFKRFHPGGKLGAVLAFVRDLMHVGDAVPLISLEARMSEALIVMTQKSFGCVGVVDEAGALVGIVTDGDLRRHMGPELTAMRVEAVMTRAPRVVAPDDLAAQALSELEGRSITALFVVENHKPVGLVHIHDLLKIGIA